MKILRLLLLAAPALLAGCNSQQKVEASNQVQRAGHDIRQAVHKAQAGLSNTEITAKVKTAMHASDRLNTSGIDVSTSGRVVTLKGAVANAQQKALAQHIAQDTVGQG